MNKQTYLVDYSQHGEFGQCEIDVHQDIDGRFYAVNLELFGCGKSYSTPAVAIDNLLCDHLCHVCKLTVRTPFISGKKEAQVVSTDAVVILIDGVVLEHNGNVIVLDTLWIPEFLTALGTVYSREAIEILPYMEYSKLVQEYQLAN